MSLLIKPSAASAKPTSLSATIIVVVVVIAATASFLTGHTAGSAIGLAGGAGMIGVEIVQRFAVAIKSEP